MDLLLAGLQAEVGTAGMGLRTSAAARRGTES
jgi:hypothetical protein